MIWAKNTLTWSIVPDGTEIRGWQEEPTSGSNLVATLNQIRRTDWLDLFAQAFQQWDAISGLRFVYEPNDDGALLLVGGSPNIRGDIRIGGHYIDGQSGQNILAYNFYPQLGDMVIDTSNVLFLSNTRNNSRGTRNMIAHEIGHGLGLPHVYADGNILMEPSISYLFDGPQFPDILAIQELYGDNLEDGSGNNDLETATDLGIIQAGKTIALGGNDFISINGSDVDYFSFTVEAPINLTINVEPTGSTYQVDGKTINALQQNDLAIELFDNSYNLIEYKDANSLGGSESLSSQLLPGRYFARVAGNNDKTQMYSLKLIGQGEAVNGVPITINGVRKGAELSSYDPRQDLVGDYTVSGDEVTLTGNTWKKLDIGSYTITPNTVLSFDFKSTKEGEIHGIGFDTDNNISRAFKDSFQVFGSQKWTDNRVNYAGNGWQSFEIPVGSYTRGTFNYLSLINDDDSYDLEDRVASDSSFRNIVLSEV